MSTTDIKYLYVRLQLLVIQEEYEKAAKIRDWIRELEELEKCKQQNQLQLVSTSTEH